MTRHALDRSATDLYPQPLANADVHLWLAVIDRGVRDIEALERAKGSPAALDNPLFNADYNGLKRWFASSSMDTGAFNWICSLVGMAPQWARERISDRIGIFLMENPLPPPKPKKVPKLRYRPNRKDKKRKTVSCNCGCGKTGPNRAFGMIGQCYDKKRRLEQKTAATA